MNKIKNLTIAQVQKLLVRHDGGYTWSLDDHLRWYHHRVKAGRIVTSFGFAKATVSRNKREGHYWCKSQGSHLRYPLRARYKYGKPRSIDQGIMYNPEYSKS